MRLKVTRLRQTTPLPAYATAGSAAFDLAAAEDVEIPPGEIRLVGTGLVFAVPEGYFLGIFARSSTPLKRGLIVANGVGVLDSDDFSSLKAGFWVVFAGQYDDQAAAADALDGIDAKDAYIRRITPD